MKNQYLLNAFMQSVWAIQEDKLHTLTEIVARHVAGEKLSAEEVQARIHGATRPPQRTAGKIGVLPLFGVIFPRGNLMVEMSGATSAETFSRQLDKLLQDPEIDSIVLDIDSPGGAVSGIAEVAAKIYASRGQKKITAVANHLAASAAYWIGTAAEEFVVSPSAEVGSIGVFAGHTDYSEAYKGAGIKVTLISAGKYKTAGNPYEPLSKEAREVIQKRVDEIYDQFVAAVALHRGVKESTVRNGFGEGSVVGAEEAARIGMADRVATLEDVVKQHLTPSTTGARVESSVDPAMAGGEESAVVVIKADGEIIERWYQTGTGQAPGADQTYTSKARARLYQVGTWLDTGESKMIRELLAKRATLVERCEAIISLADKESRDLTDEERAEFEGILGNDQQPGTLAAMDVQIERAAADREKLRIAAAKSFGVVAASPEQPAGDPLLKTMAEFNAMSPAERVAYSQAGGKIKS